MIDKFRKVMALLGPEDRRRFYVLFAITMVVSLVQAGSVASILPLITIIANPSIIDTNGVLNSIYNGLQFSSKESFTLFFGILVLVYFIFTQAMRAFGSYYSTRFTEMRSYNMTMRLFRGYLNQPYVWFLHRHSSDLGKSVLAEVNQLAKSAMMPIVQLMSNITVAVFILFVVVLVNPVVALVGATVLGASYGLIYFAVRNRLRELGTQRFDANRARFRLAGEAMGGIKDVKLIGLEQIYATRFGDVARLFARCQAETAVMRIMPRYALETLAFGSMIFLVVATLAGNPTALADVLPVVGVYAFAAIRLFPAVQSIYGSIATLRNSEKALATIHHDFEITNGGPVHDRNAVEALPLRQEITLDEVHYAYPQSERPALRGLSLTVRANSTVGIVGGTGAGKTTMVDIVLGLLTPQNGRLLIDGVPIDEGNIRSWQKSVGYVPQQIFLVDSSIRENIAFGVPPAEIDHDAVEKAAQIAELHDFVVNDLPNGYDTVVGERGVRLSGGQRQRIGIARALYHDPDMLVLDEATSALDNLTEKAVMDAVHNLGTRKTIILIAHRLTTVKSCNTIFMLEHGRVVAQGTYAELLEKSDRFRAMATAV